MTCDFSRRFRGERGLPEKFNAPRALEGKKRGSCGTVIQLGSPHRNLMGRDAATSLWIGAMLRRGTAPGRKGTTRPFVREGPTGISGEGKGKRNGRILACASTPGQDPSRNPYINLSQIPSNVKDQWRISRCNRLLFYLYPANAYYSSR